MKLFPFIFILLLPGYGVTQTGIEMIHGNAVDPNRYTSIKNSPYLFDDWIYATIVQSTGKPIEGVKINFNGYTQNFEAKNGQEIIEVELGYFIGIKLEAVDSSCGRQSFLKFEHPKLFNKYPLFVFMGAKHRLVKDFRANLADQRIESFNKMEYTPSFSGFATYYLITGQEMELIKLNEKEILKLAKEKGAEEFIKTNAVDLSTESGLCQLLSWLEKK